MCVHLWPTSGVLAIGQHVSTQVVLWGFWRNKKSFSSVNWAGMDKKVLYETHHWHSGSIDINGPISMEQLQNVVFSEQRFIIFSGLIPFLAIFISSWGFWKNLNSPWFVFRLIKLSFAKNVFFFNYETRPVHCNLSWFTRTGSILVDYVWFAAKKFVIDTIEFHYEMIL